MRAVARWDAFLAQIEQRHRDVRAELEATAHAATDATALSHHWMAIENRLQDLETKIIDTWHEKVDDALSAEGLDTAPFYAKGEALRHALDDAREELHVRAFAALARRTGAANPHAVAQEAATPEWRAMRVAERAMHAQRPPYSLASLKAYERAQIAYWFKYLGVRAHFEPVLARDPAREVRDRMEQWYAMFADQEQAWVAAGRPRESL